ncbi:flavin reductase [Bartonella sp. CB178]|uniref:flavin reductase n=1 Tax=Bartonella sp. CB178 TaxID=3112255 RepID=UPI00300DEA3D
MSNRITTRLMPKAQRAIAVSQQEYRDIMSHFAGAVHIVTTNGSNGKRGVTVSACCSLSDDPPTLLVCLKRYNPKNKLFIKNGNFCVNSLAGKHRALADIFSKRGNLTHDECFDLVQWDALQTGAPSLLDALVSIDCRLTCCYEHATHYVLIGEVVAVSRNEKEDALIYLNRKYRTLPL